MLGDMRRKRNPSNDESEDDDEIDIDEFQRSLSSIEQSPNSANHTKTAHMSIIDNFEEIKPTSEAPKPSPIPKQKTLIYLTLTTTVFTLSLLYIIKRKKIF